jgi:hypothetical protein
VKKQPGFIMRVAHPMPVAFNVGEVWESQEQQESYGFLPAPTLLGWLRGIPEPLRAPLTVDLGRSEQPVTCRAGV